MTNLKIQMFANNKFINFSISGFVSFSRDVEMKGKPPGSLTCATINTFNIPLINRTVAQFFDVYFWKLPGFRIFLWEAPPLQQLQEIEKNSGNPGTLLMLQQSFQVQVPMLFVLPNET